MAVYPESVFDLAEMSRDDRIARIVSKLENRIDSKLQSQEFIRMGKYDDDRWEWTELKKQLKKAKKGVAYIVHCGYNGFDLSEYHSDEIRAAYKRLRRMYQTHDWFNILFWSEDKKVCNIAIIKEGVWK